MDERHISALRAALAEDPSVQVAYLFGYAARGEDATRSDIDVAVLADQSIHLRRQALLSEALGRITGEGYRVDVVDLRTASPVLCWEVVRDGVVLVERDRLTRFDFEMDAIRRFEDTRPLRRIQHELLREAARGSA
jgi:predicted nucleotidyltransferase